MITKNPHTSNLLTKKTHPMVELFFEFAQLKNLYRQGWLREDISKLDCESVADHSFGVALLGYIIAEEYRPDLNSNHVMKLGLFHEIGEIYAGDVTPLDGISLEDKLKKEQLSTQQVFSKFSNPDKYISLWQEFEDQITPESIFMKQVDRLEMALQANLYERMGYDGLDDFFHYVQKKINSPELKSIFNQVLESR